MGIDKIISREEPPSPYPPLKEKVEALERDVSNLKGRLTSAELEIDKLKPKPVES